MTSTASGDDLPIRRALRPLAAGCSEQDSGIPAGPVTMLGRAPPVPRRRAQQRLTGSPGERYKDPEFDLNWGE